MLIISNPNAGDKSAPKLLKEHIIPLLQRAQPDLQLTVEETTGPGAAGPMAFNYLQESQGHGDSNPVIMILGGDTTIHEMVNGLKEKKVKEKSDININANQDIHIILIPCGTANALYHSLFPPSPPEKQQLFRDGLPKEIKEKITDIPEETLAKLYSLLFFLGGSAPKSLFSTTTSILNANGGLETSVTSSVVVSSSLHASILDTSESLRSEYPGIERFKIAAARNITQWSNAELHLPYPYQVYNPTNNSFDVINSSQFNNAKDSDSDSTRTVFSGPFAYFLTTTNVDRLEMAFRITPLATSLPPPETEGDNGGWMDVIMLRPLIRSRETRAASSDSWQQDEELRKKFASTTMKVLQTAYQDGDHVKMTVDRDGANVSDSERNEGDKVLEYLRVKEWEWKPVGSDGPANLICVDGEILRVPEGGSAKVKVNSGINGSKFHIFGGI